MKRIIKNRIKWVIYIKSFFLCFFFSVYYLKIIIHYSRLCFHMYLILSFEISHSFFNALIMTMQFKNVILYSKSSAQRQYAYLGHSGHIGVFIPFLLKYKYSILLETFWFGLNPCSLGFSAALSCAYRFVEHGAIWQVMSDLSLMTDRCCTSWATDVCMHFI